LRIALRVFGSTVEMSRGLRVCPVEDQTPVCQAFVAQRGCPERTVFEELVETFRPTGVRWASASKVVVCTYVPTMMALCLFYGTRVCDACLQAFCIKSEDKLGQYFSRNDNILMLKREYYPGMMAAIHQHCVCDTSHFAKGFLARGTIQVKFDLTSAAVQSPVLQAPQLMTQRVGASAAPSRGATRKQVMDAVKEHLGSVDQFTDGVVALIVPLVLAKLESNVDEALSYAEVRGQMDQEAPGPAQSLTLSTFGLRRHAETAGRADPFEALDDDDVLSVGGDSTWESVSTVGRFAAPAAVHPSEVRER
jgi:hypothetical protein